MSETTEKLIQLSHFTIEKTGEAVFWLDGEGRFQRVNEAACRMHGYSRDEFLKMRVHDIIRDYDPALWPKFWAAIQRDKVMKVESFHRSKDGRVFPVEVTINYFEFDGKEYICNFVRDTSEHKRAEMEITKSRNLLAEAEKIANIGSFEWDIVANKVSWSDGLYHIYGLKPQEFGATFEAFLNQVHPDHRQRVRETIEHSFRTGEPFRMEEHIVRPDGSVRVLLSKGTIIKNERGAPVRMVGICQDITERKHAEEEIRKLNAELEQRVKDRTAELEQALNDLRLAQDQLIIKEKLASLGELVAGVAHEINNPAGAVKSAADVLQRCVNRIAESLGQIGDGMQAEKAPFAKTLKMLRENIQIALTGSERIATIVRSLKSFARPEDTQLLKADIHEGLDSTLTLLHHQFKNRIDVKRNYGDVPAIHCYPQELNQVFMNMLSNAGQAIADRGEVVITTAMDGDHVYVKIADTGKGIPSEHINRIFDPGFTTKGVGVGTGLGLSISYNIIQKHRGEIRVESVVGKGTTFTIVLPRHLDQIFRRDYKVETV